MPNHREMAESLLNQIHLKSEHHDATWVQAWATVALCHSQLADAPNRNPSASLRAVIDERVMPRKITTTVDWDDKVYGEFSGADELPERIVWQGDSAKLRVVGRLANNEPFTLQDSINLKEKLDEQ